MQLKREVGIGGAVVMGLGSIVGTGVFVSLGVAAGVAGSGVLLALLLAALLAGFNGLSSAQLAAAYPVSGGTYEYANRTIGPRAGFTAGWMFLCAKSASAATAALGFASYALDLADATQAWTVPVAVTTVVALTLVVLAGARRSNWINIVSVSLSFASLVVLVVLGAPRASVPVPTVDLGLLEATALLFVAYTGYGRIATLGEEVVDPARTIPRAILATLAVVLVLYLSVAAVGVGVLGSEAFGSASAPLEAVAVSLDVPGLPWFVAVGACAAMAGVLVNLLLGLSRVLLAMGRRGDVPGLFAQVNASGTTPVPAVIAIGVFIGVLVLLGSVRTTWSFSAFTVLVYYALTNASAISMPASDRRFPVWTAWVGMLGCAFLAFWVPPVYWAAGGALLVLGHVLRMLWRRGA